MPELPEVETIKRKLSSLIIGKKIIGLEVLKEKSFHGDVSHIIGQEIVGVQRRAKILQLVLRDELRLLAHLKMTGQLIYVDEKRKIGGGHPSADWINDLPSKHTRVIIHLSGDATLFFNDMRIFGWLKLVSENSVKNEFKNYGPDINDPNLDSKYLQKKLAKKRIPIKQALMMNEIVAGLGNIYVCDALNLSCIDPFRPAQSLSFEEIEKVLDASRIVIQRGIESGGATINDYVHVDGLAGNYQNQVLVYGRTGEKCKNCGGEIKKSKIAGRGTYFCEGCQI